MTSAQRCATWCDFGPTPRSQGGGGGRQWSYNKIALICGPVRGSETRAAKRGPNQPQRSDAHRQRSHIRANKTVSKFSGGLVAQGCAICAGYYPVCGRTQDPLSIYTGVCVGRAGGDFRPNTTVVLVDQCGSQRKPVTCARRGHVRRHQLLRVRGRRWAGRCACMRDVATKKTQES